MVACRTGVIFCAFQAKRGESEASGKRELRAREVELKILALRARARASPWPL